MSTSAPIGRMDEIRDSAKKLISELKEIAKIIHSNEQPPNAEWKHLVRQADAMRDDFIVYVSWIIGVLIIGFLLLLIVFYRQSVQWNKLVHQLESRQHETPNWVKDVHNTLKAMQTSSTTPVCCCCCKTKKAEPDATLVTNNAAAVTS